MENTLLNLVPASYLPEVHLSQYDKGRELKFTLKDGSSDYSVPSGAVVTVKATKPSGLGFVVNAVADGNVVTLSNTETMTNENGRFPAELSIVQGQTVIGTSNFIFNIERSPHPEGTIDGDAETLLPELTLLVERIEAAADSVDEDTQTVTDAKAEVLQAKADTLQAKADTLSAKADALQAKADAIAAKESAEASAQAAAESAQEAEDTLSEYAKVDGYYEEMAVGSAEQLLSTQFVEDSVPYKFRTSGGSKDIGNREYDEIVGGSIVWNQLYKRTAGTVTEKGLTEVATTDGVLTITGTPSDSGNCFGWGVSNVKNHVYFLAGNDKSGKLYLSSQSFGSENGNGTIIKNTNANATWYYTVYIPQSLVGTDIGTVTMRPVVIDLTQMFGSTIADYIYSLETAQSGKGVAFFKSLFPNDYYPYNAGELLSVEGLQSHDTVGFNQLVTQPTYGYQFTFDRTKATKVLKGQKYQYTFENVKNATNWRTVLNVWDLDGNKIVETTGDVNEQNAFTSDPARFYASNLSNPYYPEMGNNTLKEFEITFNQDCYVMFGIFFGDTSATTEVENACLHLVWSGWRNGEYEPYKKHSYALDSSLTLRGILKLNAQNELYFDGDIYSHDGKVQRKYGIVDLGTLNWGDADFAGSPVFRTADLQGIAKDYGDGVCTKLLITKTYATVRDVNGVMRINDGYWSSSSPYTVVHDETYADATAFKTAMSGVYLIYELATPTEETAEPFEEVQIVDDFGTEEYISGNIVPVGHNTKYPANLRDKLQHLPNMADSDGAYLIRQTNKQMSLEVFRIPKAPTTDGTYTLKATVSGGTPTYVWEAVE